MKETERYPLSWPFGWPRTPVAKRKRAKFSTQRNAQHTRADGSVAVYSQSQALTVSAAMDRLRGELARLGGGNILVRVCQVDICRGSAQESGAWSGFSLKSATSFAASRDGSLC